MMKRITPWLKGIVAPLIAMLIFAVPIGVFMALALLVFAMEEGGETMSSLALPLTRVIVLLSQGVGMHAGAIVLSITPLLLTCLMILLIRAVYSRFSTDLPAYIVGVIVWMLLCIWCGQEQQIKILDSNMMIACKSAIVFTLGFAWRALPDSEIAHKAIEYCRDHISAPVRSSIRVGIRLAIRTLAVMLACGFLTLISWICLNHANMRAMFEALQMNLGSQILMCVIAVAWLPNLCLWAMSWLFGGGFHIGEAATYSLWSKQIHELPQLPIFGLFPNPVDNANIRLCLMAIPIIIGFVLGLLTLLLHRGFHLRGIDPQQPVDWRNMLLSFAYPVGSFCITAALISLLSSLLYWISDGALGTGRLAHVGVDVMQSSNVTARPCAIGLGLAWICAIVIAAVRSLIRMILANRKPQETSSTEEPADSEDDEHEHKETPHTPRVVNSTPREKEMQGDD